MVHTATVTTHPEAIEDYTHPFDPSERSYEKSNDLSIFFLSCFYCVLECDELLRGEFKTYSFLIHVHTYYFFNLMALIMPQPLTTVESKNKGDKAYYFPQALP